MAKLSYSQIVPKKIIRHQDEPYEVLDSLVFSKQQRKPVNQTKLRHLVSGKVIEHSFQANDKIEEVEVEVRPITYIYSGNGESWFHEEGDKGSRFSLPDEQIAEQTQWLVEGASAEAILVDDEIINIRIPIKVELEVSHADPAVRGNTAQGATKSVTLASGAEIQVPLFINKGDVIRINTETGNYTERVSKA